MLQGWLSHVTGPSENVRELMNRSAVEMNCTKKKRMNVEAEVGIYKRKQESKKT